MYENLWTPGTLVTLPTQPDWGMGQVQSAVGSMITVNFENAGKRVLNVENVQLVAASIEDDVEKAE